jgi:hypothetical protein
MYLFMQISSGICVTTFQIWTSEAGFHERMIHVDNKYSRTYCIPIQNYTDNITTLVVGVSDWET